MIYISNRAEHLIEPTLANLRAVGLPVKDDSVFLGLGTHVPDCEQEGSEKLCRRQFAGPQLSRADAVRRPARRFRADPGQHARSARRELQAQHRVWFGERWWMLPNPTYGSWEPALFNNNWRDAARRATRHQAQGAGRGEAPERGRSPEAGAPAPKPIKALHAHS